MVQKLKKKKKHDRNFFLKCDDNCKSHKLVLVSTDLMFQVTKYFLTVNNKQFQRAKFYPKKKHPEGAAE